MPKIDRFLAHVQPTVWLGRVCAAFICAAGIGLLPVDASAAAPAASQRPGVQARVAAPVGGLVRDQADARDPVSGRLLYREQHLLRRDADGRPLERVVVYRCPGGDARAGTFARKRLDYRTSAVAPRFAFEDARSGYREGLRTGTPPTLFVARRAGEAERSAALATAGVVVDAGFDEFVRANWAALSSGRTLSLAFALPARLRSYRFTVARVAGADRVGNAPALRLRLQLSGLLAWVAPHVDASYDLATRRLLRFEGPGTIRDSAGRNPLPVRIDFGGAITTASEADWRGALAAPLSACADGHRADAVTRPADSAGHVASG